MNSPDAVAAGPEPVASTPSEPERVPLQAMVAWGDPALRTALRRILPEENDGRQVAVAAFTSHI
jgi:FXSXX-COOH protein